MGQDTGIQRTAAVATPRGGAKVFRTLSLLATTQAVKTTPGRIFSIHAHNLNAAVRYLKIYNKSNAVVGDTSLLVLTLALAPGANQFLFPAGVDFSAAIGVRATTEAADNGTTNPTANETIVNITYA